MSGPEEPSTVRRLRVEEMPEKTKPTEPPKLSELKTTALFRPETDPPPPPMPTPENPTSSQSFSSLELLVAALSARSLLMLALIGAFVLSIYVMMHESPLNLAALVVYCLFAILPVAYLEIRRGL